VLLFIYMGAWLGSSSIGDWISCTLFGLLGFVMKRGGWARPPVVLALVLGGILEGSFQISMRIHQGVGWLGRPIVIVILLIISTSVFMGWRRLSKQKPSASPQSSKQDRPNPVISLPLAVALFGMFVWAGIESLDWPRSVRQLPVLVTTVGALLSLVVLFQDTRNLLHTNSETGDWSVTLVEGWRRGMMPEAMKFLAYLVGLILVTLLVGMKVALPLMLVMFLRYWGGLSLKLSLGYGLVGWLVIVGFYDQILGLTFYPSWLGLQLQSVIPGEWVRWLFI